MLQPSTTSPGLSKVIGVLGEPAYNFSVNTFAGEKEYTW